MRRNRDCAAIHPERLTLADTDEGIVINNPLIKGIVKENFLLNEEQMKLQAFANKITLVIKVRGGAFTLSWENPTNESGLEPGHFAIQLRNNAGLYSKRNYPDIDAVLAVLTPMFGEKQAEELVLRIVQNPIYLNFVKVPLPQAA